LGSSDQENQTAKTDYENFAAENQEIRKTKTRLADFDKKWLQIVNKSYKIVNSCTSD